nr:hypothetical protein Itr_chr07CG14390 [Ipomoea trifida]
MASKTLFAVLLLLMIELCISPGSEAETQKLFPQIPCKSDWDCRIDPDCHTCDFRRRICCWAAHQEPDFQTPRKIFQFNTA